MNLFKDSSYLFTSNVLLVAMSLVTGMLTARFLGPEGKGEFYLVLQASSLASLVLSGGLGPSYQYHLKKGLLDYSGVVWHIAVQSVIVVGLLLVALTASEYLPSELLQRALGSGLALPVVAATALNIWILYANSVLMTFDSGIRTSCILSVLSSTINMALLGLFLWGLRLGISGALAAYLASLVVRLLPTGWVLLRREPLRPQLSWRRHSPMLFGYGSSSFICNLMLSSVFRVDVFIVSSLAGVAAVGVYSVAVAFAEMALMAPNAIGIALFSHLPGVSQADQLEIVGRSSRITVLIALAGGALLVLFSRPLVTILMGQRFSGAVLPLVILVPGLVMMSANYVFANYYASQGRPLVSASCFGIGLVVDVAANYLLIPSLGVEGAALASSVAYSCITASFILILRREHRLRYRDFLLPGSAEVALVKAKIASLLGRRAVSVS